MKHALAMLAAVLAVATSDSVSAAAPPKKPPAKPPARKQQPADPVLEASIADLQKAMQSGQLTSKAITQRYLDRIKAIDKSGPTLNSVIEVNPDALKDAEAMDAERKKQGPRGPLHGIPVLLKDNIATADKMKTTAGSIALEGAKSPRDAFVVTRLRDSGAVILGKTNLSEWANMRSIRSTSGWSSRGGLTRNPYALDRSGSGSSTGSAVAVAASLATVAIGTETDGSIVSPSSANSLVGIKPTVGLVSRAGIVPISISQDTAGPMARTVADAAAVLEAISGTDPADKYTADASVRKAEYTKSLDPNALKGARIGVVRSHLGGRNDLQTPVIEKALEVLKAQGAILVDVNEFVSAEALGKDELTVMLYELKNYMNAYLEQYAPGAEVQTLAEIIDFNERNREKTMPWFGQEHLVAAQEKGGLDSLEYLQARGNGLRMAREEGIDKAMREHKLDALVAPTAGLPWMIDFIKGDNSGGGFTSTAAVAGYPHVTVPAGFVHGLPVGLSFVGAAWSEARLIGFAYAFEQATKHRRAPTYPKSVNVWDSP
jgi:amidase